MMWWKRTRTAILSAFVFLILITVTLPVQAATSGPDARPNIIVIMTDDQDTASISKLPETQSLLVDKGMTFKTNIVTYAKCCPSRASFITGQYPHNTGVEANSLPYGSYAKMDNTNTLSLWLQNSGYYTGHIGKYLNGYGQLDTNQSDDLEAWQEIPAGYSEWYGTIDPTTYHYYNYSMNENGTLVQYGNTAEDYQTDVLSHKAVDFIERRAQSKDGKPFFLIITPLAPHHDNVDPLGPEPAEEYNGMFAHESLPKPPNFNELDISDKPPILQTLPVLNTRSIQIMTGWYQKRLETLQSVDDMVESVMDTLDETGQLDNTIIIFTSDNGWLQGENRVPYGKEFAYEPSIRVPLVIRGPGIPEGQNMATLVANIDLAPTIVELSDATPLRTMDGISLVPAFSGLSLTPRYGVEIECKGIGAGKADAEGEMLPENGLESLNYYAIRTDRYIYIQYADNIEEMYDLYWDPYEMRNIANSGRYTKTKKTLITHLESLKTCHGSSCLT